MAKPISLYNLHMTHPDSATPDAPLFSVIIPLEFHRGHWERCWQGWQAQSLSPSEFEIIMVVPPDFPQCDKLKDLLGGRGRIEYSQARHDIGLCADGAAVARGRFLFFTESHCWPEPDVLELCLEALRDRPGWAGLSCGSVPVTHNKLSVAEADMYDADIEYGMNRHPWRKILDQCFVTRREPYHRCGGFQAEFGHFSEWLLAARYHAAGFEIGYLPQARLHHYYVGDLAELKTFTLDFVAGEIAFFNRDSPEPSRDLLEAPPEWICRDNFEPGTARAILWMVVADLAAPGAWSLGSLRRICRWLVPAIAGDRLERATSAAAVRYTYLALRLAMVLATRDQLGRRLKDYIAALVRSQRLAQVGLARRKGLPAAPQRQEVKSRTRPILASQTGFYPLEQHDGCQFRWSETEAAIRIEARPGRLALQIGCAQFRSLSNNIDLRFYCDGRRLPKGATKPATDGFELQIVVPSSGTTDVGWLCRAFPAARDPRALGLPVMRIELA